MPARKFRVIPPIDFAEIAFENTWDPILILTHDYKVVSMNTAASEMTGFLRAELQSDSIEKLRVQSKLPSRSRTFELEFIESNGRFEDVMIQRKDGGLRVVDFSTRTVKHLDTVYYVVLFRDVTDRKQMERELISKHQEIQQAYLELEKKNHELKATQETLVQAGKLAALGELAAGVAHELNQPLQSIRGYTQELQSILAPELLGKKIEASVNESMQEVISHVDKMAKIISHLRSFTRRSTEDMDWVDVRDPIRESLKMLDRQFKSRGIDVETFFDEDCPKVFANSLQLEQVFINLATNARDAIESKGTGKGKITISTRKAGDFAEIKFRDDGIGMNDRVAQKAFNPFFTTKEVGKGMGLGLSLSYGMISKVQGSIRIESQLGKSTEFTIQLPRDFRELG
jgi:PAS domain S-box-containing protein